jgi:hypothetical protein
MVLPIWELGSSTATARGCKNPGSVPSRGHAYSAPYEDVRIKK